MRRRCALRRAFATRSLGIHRQIQRQNALVLAAQHGQHPVAWGRGPRLVMGEIVGELGAFRLFARHHFGLQSAHLFHVAAQAPQELGTF